MPGRPRVSRTTRHRAFTSPKDANESLLQATSADNGRTWTSNDSTGRLRLRSDCAITAGTGGKADAPATVNDNGQGHPFVLTAGGTPRLYTLDRQSGVVDSGGLLVHTLPAGGLAGLPQEELLARHGPPARSRPPA